MPALAKAFATRSWSKRQRGARLQGITIKEIGNILDACSVDILRAPTLSSGMTERSFLLWLHLGLS
jgi:hypothetical protein